MIDVFAAFDSVRRNVSCNTAYIVLYYTGLSIKLNFLFLVISRSIHVVPPFPPPANFVPPFPVLRFPPLRFVPSFSSPAFSTIAIWSLVFQSCVFHPRKFHGPAFSSPAFSASPSISNHFRDNGHSLYLGHDLDLSRSRDVIVHVTI